MLHEADRVVATHDLKGMFQGGTIRQGTTGVIIGHCGHDLPTYRVRFTIRPGRTAVVGEITEDDISKS
jgi:hypothetical protein